jgi:hypothetical protein
MNAELAALRVLAQAIADRLGEEHDRCLAAGHGRHDADPADLAALMRGKQDWDDAEAVVATLRRHISPQYCDHCGTPDGACRVAMPPDGVEVCKETNRVVEGDDMNHADPFREA